MSEQWWWCLTHGRAEREPDRPSADLLGPYASEEDARAWRERNEARNERWDREDDAWKGR
jgi:hypothetical protein